jgi:hypothetical protein
MEINMTDRSWAVNEFGTTNFGDYRLTKRLVKLADSLSELPVSSINQACGSWAASKAAYRFFQNDKIDVNEIASGHKKRTVSRIQEYQTALAIQDTSYFTYTNHKQTSGLGVIASKIGTNKHIIKSDGVIMHTSFAVSTQGLPLGILDQNIYAREEIPKEIKELKKRSHRNALSIEDKESMKWLNSLTNSHSPLKSSKTRLVTVCDREADMYDFFESAFQNESSVLVRANHNRIVSNSSLYSEKNKCKLWEFIQSAPSHGNTVVKIPSQQGRPARTATMNVHFTSFTMYPSKNNVRTKTKNLPQLTLFAVYVTEKNPPLGIDALEWMLLTNIPVTTFDEALEKVSWYCLRWRIEIFHKVLKSGLRVEDCRLSTAQRLIRYLTVMSIIAYRIYFTTLIARTNPTLPCDMLLSENEWKVLYSKVHRTKNYPKKIPIIKDAVKWIAQLGGFLARKNDGDPGVTTIWRGWRRLTDLSEGWVLANEL